MSSSVDARLQELSQRYGLPGNAAPRLALFLDLLAAEPAAITSVRDPARGVETHVADSLVALELPAVREAHAIADLGSGGGLPGLPLAVALPSATVRLVESSARKCAFLEVAVDRLSATNVEVVHARAEAWPEGLRRHDLVTARALAPMTVLLEYAAPLLGPEGFSWPGRGLLQPTRSRMPTQLPRYLACRGRPRSRSNLSGAHAAEPSTSARRLGKLRNGSLGGREWPANDRSEPRWEGDGDSAPKRHGAGNDRLSR